MLLQHKNRLFCRVLEGLDLPKKELVNQKDQAGAKKLMLLYLFVVGFVGGIIASTVPEQIHLALTGKLYFHFFFFTANTNAWQTNLGNVGEMRVMWLTPQNTPTSSVIFWNSIDNKNHTATGTSDYYMWPLPPYVSGQIHSKYIHDEALN